MLLVIKNLYHPYQFQYPTIEHIGDFNASHQRRYRTYRWKIRACIIYLAGIYLYNSSRRVAVYISVLCGSGARYYSCEILSGACASLHYIYDIQRTIEVRVSRRDSRFSRASLSRGSILRPGNSPHLFPKFRSPQRSLEIRTRGMRIYIYVYDAQALNLLRTCQCVYKVGRIDRCSIYNFSERPLQYTHVCVL